MKNSRGITLIALVITIIVMMILTAVTVGIAVNGGLFNYAGKTAKRTDQEKVREEIQSILPMYYLERDNMTLKDFLTANLMGDVAGFSQKFETTFGETEIGTPNPISTITGYTFYYEGYGFFIEKGSLRLSLLDNMDKTMKTDSFGLYEKITNIDDLESGKNYLIASKEIKSVNIDGNNEDAYYVMYETEERNR